MTAIATVKSDGLNVRSRAYQDASKIDVLTKGDKVKVLERRYFDGGHVWLKVKLNSGKEGWIDARFVDVATCPDEEPPHVPVPDDGSDIIFYLKLVGAGLALIAIAALARCAS